VTGSHIRVLKDSESMTMAPGKPGNGLVLNRFQCFGFPN
jgi:hypothetical protein